MWWFHKCLVKQQWNRPRGISQKNQQYMASALWHQPWFRPSLKCPFNYVPCYSIRNELLSIIPSLSRLCLFLPGVTISIHRYDFLCFNFMKETFTYILAFDSKTSMRCYSEKTGPKYQICDNSFGFQTCFTKYDDRKF